MTRSRVLALGLMSLPLIAIVVAVIAFGWGFSAIQSTQATTFGAGSMNLKVAGATSCDSLTNPTTCTVPLSGGFTVNVEFNQLPGAGFVGFATDLTFGALTYNPTGAASGEIKVTPTLPLLLRDLTNVAQGEVFHGGATGVIPPLPVFTFKGNAVNLSFTCTAGNSAQTLNLVPYDPINNPAGSSYIDDGGNTVPTSDGPVTINCGAPSTATPTNTSTPTNTPTVTKTPTVTLSPTPCPTVCDTPTITRTPTITDTPTNTSTPTATFTATRTVTPTRTNTNTPGPTSTPTTTGTPTATPTSTATLAATATNSPTAIFTPTATYTPTVTLTPTRTSTPTVTPTPTPLFEKVSGHLPAGGKLTTDTEGDGATPHDPVEVSVTLPSATFPFGGDVEINELLITNPDPSGFAYFGQQVNVKAPDGNWQDPIIIVFLLDGSIIPDGQNETTVTIFKNGVKVRECTGHPGEAVPDPCVAKRHRLVGQFEGDVSLTVLTSTASLWNFALVSSPAPTPVTPVPTRKVPLGDANADGHVDSLDAFWILLFDAGLVDSVPAPHAADVNLDGHVTPEDAMLILQFEAGLIDGLPPVGISGSGPAGLLPRPFLPLW